MAKLLIAAQRHSSGKMLQRGAFSQKKKLWESIEELVGKEEFKEYQLYDDIDESTIEANYPRLCKALSNNGRIILIDAEGIVQFMIVESEKNEWRDWDLDDDGSPVPNPVKKD